MVQLERASVLTPTEGTTLARLMALFLNFCLGDTSPPEEREDRGSCHVIR
jgi:hypothetical protein